MTDTRNRSSKARLVTDNHNDHSDDEDRDTSSTSEPSSAASDDRHPQDPQFLLVVVGKAGTGKSSLCNLIAGNDLFPVSSGLSVCTVKTQEETVTRGGQTFCVMDTPGDKEGDMAQLAKSLKERLNTFNNKVFFLFCVRCEARYAVEEHSVFRELITAWKDEEDLKSRLLVAFTYSDKLSPEAGKGENFPTDSVTRDTGAKHDSLDAPSLYPGAALREKEREARKSAKERSLDKMLDVSWPQLKDLVSYSQRRFIFSNKETSKENDIQALIDYAANNRPESPDRRKELRARIIVFILIVVVFVAVIFVAAVVLVKYLTASKSEEQPFPLSNSTTDWPINFTSTEQPVTVFPANSSDEPTTVFAETNNTTSSG